MNTTEFLEQFSLIEKYLLSITPTFDPKQGFFNLLKNLQSNKLISDDLIIILRDIFQVRNKIVNSPSDTILAPDIIEKIKKVRQGLNI